MELLFSPALPPLPPLPPLSLMFTVGWQAYITEYVDEHVKEQYIGEKILGYLGYQQAGSKQQKIKAGRQKVQFANE